MGIIGCYGEADREPDGVPTGAHRRVKGLLCSRGAPWPAARAPNGSAGSSPRGPTRRLVPCERVTTRASELLITLNMMIIIIVKGSGTLGLEGD